MNQCINQSAIDYIMMLRETTRPKPEERWVLTCLIGRCKAAIDAKHPSDILRYLRSIVGYRDLSSCMQQCCNRLEALATKWGDEWHA